jgi:hypothetical protein
MIQAFNTEVVNDEDGNGILGGTCGGDPASIDSSE